MPYDYEYLNRIEQHYEVLSESEKKIADFILGCADSKAGADNGLSGSASLLSMSAIELAAATDTSSATIIRFCKTLGFKGLTELKYYISRGILSSHRKSDPLNVNDSISIVRQKISAFNRYAIEDTTTLLDDKVLTMAVNMISRARKILFLGEGGSGSAARLGWIEFRQIGIDCDFVEDSFTQMLYADRMNERDVVIAISHSGRALDTIDVVTHAKSRGAFIVVITSIVNAPLAKLSDATLYISSMEHEFFSNTAAARLCEINVISIIHSALQQIFHDDLMETDERVQRVYEIKRVKPER